MATNRVSLSRLLSHFHSSHHAQDTAAATGLEKPHHNGVGTTDHATHHRQPGAHNYSNPLSHVATNDPDMRFQAFGGDFQPGLYRGPSRQFANPAPLGLSAFALTTFVLSLINMSTRNLSEPNIVVAAAFGYGGLVQLCAGMW